MPLPCKHPDSTKKDVLDTCRRIMLETIPGKAADVAAKQADIFVTLLAKACHTSKHLQSEGNAQYAEQIQCKGMP